MKRTLFVLVLGCLIAAGLRAAPPRCKTVEQNGTTFEVCERHDVMCEALAKEHLRDPSKEWNGCAWPAWIYNSHVTTSGLLVFYTSINIVPSYVDSERLDVTVTFDRPYCGARVHVQKDVPIIIRDDRPSASIHFACAEQPYGVPTVEATERGGKKQAFHSYK